MDAERLVRGIVEPDEAADFQEGVATLKIEFRAVVAVISVHVTEAERPPKSDRTAQDVIDGGVASPKIEKFAGKGLDGERQVVAAESLDIPEIGFLCKALVIGEENRRARDVFAVLIVIFEFPFVASEELVGEGMFSLVVGDDIGGRAAK
jgi:hypothetical protein